MRKKLIAIGILGLCLCLASCAALTPWFGRSATSVEAVLRQSQSVARELDAEQADVDADTGEGEEEPTSPEARRLPSLRPPLRKLAYNSPFGKRGGHAHTGVDLAAKEGTPVYAALDGIVVYASDRISGYGETIIVRHARGFSTLYAHVSEMRVDAGDHVHSGQCIALSGQTGNASGPHLHFEIRDGLQPIDPRPLWH